MSNVSVFRATTLFMLESLTTMPTEEAQLNAFWAGEPTSKQSKRSSSSRGGPSKKRKRVQKDMGEIDTSTGIFDDSEDDTSDEAEAQVTSQLVKKMGQHELLTLAAHRKAFSAAWRAFLGTGLTEDEIKRVLVMLHRQVLPHLVEPGMLVDFLADCTDYGR
jgi:U3 small nucleolar RNA-associated protein 19